MLMGPLTGVVVDVVVAAAAPVVGLVGDEFKDDSAPAAVVVSGVAVAVELGSTKVLLLVAPAPAVLLLLIFAAVVVVVKGEFVAESLFELLLLFGEFVSIPLLLLFVVVEEVFVSRLILQRQIPH